VLPNQEWIQGNPGVYTPSPPLLRNDFVPLSFTNLVYSYTMEGNKKCPIYPCTPSFKKNFWIRPGCYLAKIPLLGERRERK
jgi:hypothetical protein